MTGMRVGFDLEALQVGAGQMSEAGEAFGRYSGQIGDLPRAAAPLNAAALLDRLLTSVGDVLARAAGELDSVGSGLSNTAATYANAERILANWNVPGGGTTL